jgi:ABC-type glutathione transport system ATPase component
MTEPLLSVRGLHTHLGDALDPVRAVDGVSFDILAGETCSASPVAANP